MCGIYAINRLEGDWVIFNVIGFSFQMMVAVVRSLKQPFLKATSIAVRLSGRLAVGVIFNVLHRAFDGLLSGHTGAVDQFVIRETGITGVRECFCPGLCHSRQLVGPRPEDGVVLIR